MEDFHKRFKYLLKTNGISAKKFADLMGVPVSRIYSWLYKSTTMPQVRDIPKIAELLGTSCEFLITGNKNYLRTVDQMRTIIEHQDRMLRDQMKMITNQQKMIEHLKNSLPKEGNHNPLG